MSTQIIAVGVSSVLRDALGDYNEHMFDVTPRHIEDLNAAEIRSANRRSTAVLVNASSGKMLDAPRELRMRGFCGPVLGITDMPRDSVEDEHVDAERFFLLCGGDRLIRSPFTARLVAYVIESLLRRPMHESREKQPAERAEQGIDEIVFGKGRVRMQLETRQCLVDGKAVRLRSSEFMILFHIARRPGVAFSRKKLLEELDFEVGTCDRAIDMRLGRCRVKFRKAATGADKVIETIYGLGYRAQA